MASHLRVDERVVVRDPAWPKTDVVVLPGIPGWGPPDGSDIEYPFPDSTTDAVKVLRSKGLAVAHIVESDNRQRVSLNASEWWIPVLVFASQIGANTLGDLLAGAIRQIVGAVDLSRAQLHVDVGHEQKDGTVTFFRAHGSAKDVIEAYKLHLGAERES